VGELETTVLENFDYWLRCPECNTIEGGYYELTEEQYENLDNLDLRELEENHLIKITRL
jgi:hypothetical protein